MSQRNSRSPAPASPSKRAASESSSSQEEEASVLCAEAPAPLVFFTARFERTAVADVLAAVQAPLKLAFEAERAWAAETKPEGRDPAVDMTVTYAAVLEDDVDGDGTVRFELYPNRADSTCSPTVLMAVLCAHLPASTRPRIVHPHAYVDSRQKEGVPSVLTAGPAPALCVVTAYVGLKGKPLQDVFDAIEDQDDGFDVRCMAVCAAEQRWNGSKAGGESIAEVRFTWDARKRGCKDLHYLQAYLASTFEQDVVKAFVLPLN